jgi:hypothetical protein
MKWWHMWHIWGKENTFKILWEYCKKKSLGRHRCRQELNIKTDVKNRWESVDWINLAQDKDKW